MPPLTVQRLQRRETSPGRTFSIIFAAIAFLVVLACLILVIILPRYRKKPRVLPGSRYPVVPNYPHPFGPPPRFPSHPALLRGFRKQPAAPVQRYNPRVESPFPSSPAQSDLGSGPGHGFIHSHGLFTPPQCCLGMRHDPQAARRVTGPDPRQFTTFSAKHDYILPVPEPLILKPRPAGRPPPLTRQLERFPIPQPLDSGRSGEVVHPMKLFQELGQRVSDTTADSLGTPCPTSQKPKQPNAIEAGLMGIQVRIVESTQAMSGESCISVDEAPAAEQQHTVQELGLQPTNNGEVGLPKNNQKQGGLERMGTRTRPKTPVAEIRNRFDNAASDINNESSLSSNRLYTPASNPFTTPELSSTPPTSPEYSTEKKPLSSTPSKPNLAPPFMAVPSHAHRRTPSSVILPSSEMLTAFPFATPSRRAHRATKKSPQSKVLKKRSNAGRLKLVSWSKLRPSAQLSRRYSSSSLSTIFKPILGPTSQCSQGASSVYSRDARALSFMEAIDLPVKGSPDHRICPGWVKDQPSERQSGFSHKHSASTDYLKTKIDAWDLHTAHLDRSMYPPSIMKRSISDTGPRRGTKRESSAQVVDLSAPGRSIPVIQIGRSSDDVFGIEVDGFKGHQASIVLKSIGSAKALSAVSGGPARGTAPGGGEWI
ncbi:hypothetical protein G647_00722 [Cladophialophora carrionii CBS 160.54]|uniref:Uncharacterized protein n=1 Tax=Cladophialophora carrionii CBS 160.54 TaxID=1279043 RepID=V9DPM7_9EURO|nr:uncharacterized protein G647_00722 [Cladophialophora carrionii CBS 160.54]ETI28273.1 hypothetical protein G647_00722 [Cladophialophora carrionii CBS 160.54]